MRSSTFPVKPQGKRLTAKPRTVKCSECPTRFVKMKMGQKVCGPVCAAVAGRKATAREDRKTTAARKVAMKTIRQLIAETQVVFNAYIRTRDRLAGHPCISSGRPLDWSGNNVDAGHYRSRGSADHLRFDERNCHAQSKQDNRYGSGNAVDYRIGLIKRIGLAAVEALEADQTVVKWTRERLAAIKAEYKAKTKELKARE
jgi:hypothetical protein